MKKFMCICLILSATAFSNSIKFGFNPLQLALFNLQNFEIEKGFENNFSFGFFYAHSGFAASELGGYSIYGAEQSVYLKKYFSGFNESTFWIGGKTGIASANVWGDNGSAFNIGTFSINFISGYQLTIGSFYIDPFGSFGIAITNNLFGDNEFNGDVEETIFIPGYGVKFGMLF